MSDYTPSLAAIRQRWALHGTSGMESDRAEFDRAIAKVRADAKVEAWEEGYIKSCFDHGDGGKLHGADNINPYRADNLEKS